MDVCPRYLLVSLLGERESFTVSIDATLRGTSLISNEKATDDAEPIATLTHTRVGYTLVSEGRYSFVEEDQEVICKTEGQAGAADVQGDLTKQVLELSLEDIAKPRFLLLSGKGDYAGSLLYIRSSTSGFRTFHKWGFAYDADLTIGSDPDCTFFYPKERIASLEARLSLHHSAFTLSTTAHTGFLYINNRRAAPNTSYTLGFADTLRLFDLTIAVFPRFIACNEPEDVNRHLPEDSVLLNLQEGMYGGAPSKSYTPAAKNSFAAAPRLIKSIEPLVLSVEAPPQKKDSDDTPLLIRMGSSAVMGMASVFMGVSAVARLLQGADVLTSAPSLAMCVSLLAGMLIWPAVSRRYERRKAQTDERIRYTSYEGYLAHIEWRLDQERAAQKEILEEMRIPLELCLKRAFERDVHLFERTLQDKDALTLRLGTGDVPLEADISWPKRGFVLAQDPLLEAALTLAEKPQMVQDVPISIDLRRYTTVGIAGTEDTRDALLRSWAVQLATLVSPQEVKLVGFFDPKKKELVRSLRRLALTRASDGRTRLVATRVSDARDLDLYLAHVLAPRFARAEKDGAVFTHYVIIADSTFLTEPLDILSRIQKEHTAGVTLIYTAAAVETLPQASECVVELKDESLQTKDKPKAPDYLSPYDSLRSAPKEDLSRLFLAQDTSKTTRFFKQDIYPSPTELESVATSLARIHLKENEARFILPASLTFLKSLGASSIDALDIERRWAEADATRSLAATIGIDETGAPLILDAHETQDGPHGLVAGTTGSGKSELLISWILSLCVSFPPEQVSFVLIDYKGGGLASAFTRKNMVLPHLAGTVTNLDGSEIARSLTSLRAELTRRQRLLDEAKRSCAEATMDALSYMRHYLKGDLTEPMPELFIVADEFAEIKQQESDFMEGLISAARIGRALGVHLILATQKPEGVISDQISANSRFRVCLRVATAADSKEMLRRPDAATLEGPGRLYLLVGYDERYTLGQASYTGGIYQESLPDKETQESTVELVTATGRLLDRFSIEESSSQDLSASEFDVVLKEIVRISEGRCAHRLWLDPLEAHPTLEALRARYPDAQKDDAPWELNPIIGELDDPARQEKRALTLPLTRVGNAVIYGSVGTGAEELVSSALYDMLQRHSPQDLNVYILDFGSELLRSFEGHPCVGDIATSDETEKVRRLFDRLEKEIQTRRKILARAKKNFEAYERSSQDSLPSILLIINGMGAFMELYESYEQRLVRVLRDGIRVGIFTIVVATSASEIRLRLRQGLKQYLACELAHEDDYLQIFSNMRGVSSPHGLARGLIEEEGIKYLFQGAFIEAEDEDKQEIIEQLLKEQIYEERAFSIALMPEHIQISDLHPHQRPDALAIGLYEDNLEALYLSCEMSPMTQVFYMLPQTGREFIFSLGALAKSENIFYRLADLEYLLDSEERSSEQGSYTTDPYELLGWLKTEPSRDFELIAVTGIEEAFSRLDEQKAIKLKNELGALKRKGTRFVLLIDSSQHGSSLREGWYLKHAGQGDGIWIGSGADSSTPFRVSYGSGDKMLGDIERDQGYTLSSGRARKAQFIHIADEKKE